MVSHSPAPEQDQESDTIHGHDGIFCHDILTSLGYPLDHVLRYVLYKERNMLLTEKQLSRRKGIIFPQPERIQKVKKSMGAIKHVLGERKREKIAALALQQIEKEQEELDIEEDEKGMK